MTFKNKNNVDFTLKNLKTIYQKISDIFRTINSVYKTCLSCYAMICDVLNL